MVWLAITESMPRFRPARSDSARSAAPAWASTARASTRKTRPSSVNWMRRPTRWNRATPEPRSRLAMADDTADWVRWRISAARVTCSHSATATNRRNCSSVIKEVLGEQLDQGEAEAGDEDPGAGRQRQRLQAFALQFGEIGRQSHRRQRHREQEIGQIDDLGLFRRRDSDDAVQWQHRNEAQHEPGH